MKYIKEEIEKQYIDIVADFETYEYNPSLNLQSKTVESYCYSAGYSILAWKDYKENYIKLFYGLKSKCIYDFLNSITSEIQTINQLTGSIKQVNLWFHNASYDSKYLGWLIKQYQPNWQPNWKYAHPKKQFISGTFTWNKIRFNIKCTYFWSGESLASYPVKDSNGNEIKKLDLGDAYGKFNLRELNNQWIYQTEDGRLHKFNFELEQTYLRRDIFKTHYVLLDIFQNKQLFWDESNESELHLYSKFFNSKTIPAISKKCVEMHIGEYLDETKTTNQESYFRPLIDYELRNKLDNTLKGGLTTNNIYLSNNIVGIIDIELDKDKPIPASWIKINNHYINTTENIHSFDVNSMYPYIMTKPIPKGLPTLLNHKPKVTPNQDIFFLFTPITIKAKEPYSQIRSTIFGNITNELLLDHQIRKRYTKVGSVLVRKEILLFILEIYDITIEYNNEDILLTKENIYSVIDEIYVWNTSKQINPFMQETYLKRNNYKSLSEKYSKDSFDYHHYDRVQKVNKLMMNSTFGKLCQKTIDKSHSWDKSKQTFQLFEEEDPLNYSTVGGNFVTMEGRYILLKAIKELIDCGFTFLYGDTDSVKFKGPLYKLKHINPKALWLENKSNKGQLGVWKNEGSYTTFVTSPKRKRYVLYNYNLDNWEYWKQGINHKSIEKVFNFAYGGFNKNTIYNLIISYLPKEPTTKTGFLLPLLVIFRPDVNVDFVNGTKISTYDPNGFNFLRIRNSNKQNNKNLKTIHYQVVNDKLMKL